MKLVQAGVEMILNYSFVLLSMRVSLISLSAMGFIFISSPTLIGACGVGQLVTPPWNGPAILIISLITITIFSAQKNLAFRIPMF